jgi:lipopolysaccharide exporter
MRLPKFVDFSNDLFATIFCFGAVAVIRLGSSLVLTRVLKPEAYGIIAILMSLVFVVEMLADIGITTFVVRDKDVEIPDHFRTAWTIRFFRSMLNFVIVCGGAEIIAVKIYNLPDLVVPLRVFSLWYILVAFESLAFPISVRRKKARYAQYS